MTDILAFNQELSLKGFYLTCKYILYGKFSELFLVHQFSVKSVLTWQPQRRLMIKIWGYASGTGMGSYKGSGICWQSKVVLWIHTEIDNFNQTLGSCWLAEALAWFKLCEWTESASLWSTDLTVLLYHSSQLWFKDLTTYDKLLELQEPDCFVYFGLFLDLVSVHEKKKCLAKWNIYNVMTMFLCSHCSYIGLLNKNMLRCLKYLIFFLNGE